MNTFRDKTILITGASSGIGEAFAKLLGAEGADLILTARTKDKLQQLAEELSGKHDVTTHVVPGDLSKQETAVLLYDKIQKAGLDVDVVINNAGFGKWGHFHSVDYSTHQEMCNLNINSLLSLTHLFLPGMLKKGDGGFINVASTAGFQPVPFFTTYSATKSFVLNFTEALWVEYKNQGVTFTCLCPGATETKFHDRANADRDKLGTLEPVEKVVKLGMSAFLKGQPTVISGMKNYLLANSSRFVPRKLVAKITAGMVKPKNI